MSPWSFAHYSVCFACISRIGQLHAEEINVMHTENKQLIQFFILPETFEMLLKAKHLILPVCNLRKSVSGASGLI